MEKAHEVYWSEAAAEDLNAIIEYIRADNPSVAKESLGKIQSKTAALRSFPQRGRIVPELKAHGILQYRELVISPWRVIYRISETRGYILSVIDSRRNVEDVLLERLVRKRSR